MAKATKKASAVKASTKSSATEVNSSPAAIRFESSLNKIKSTGSAGADKIAQAVVRKVFNREMKLEGTIETGFTGKVGTATCKIFKKQIGKSNRCFITIGNVEIGGGYASKAFAYAKTATKPDAAPKVNFNQDDLDSVLKILG